MISRLACLLLLTSTLSLASEPATFDSAGRLTGLIHNGQTVPLLGHFVLVTHDGREVSLQPHDQRSPITRPGDWKWQGHTNDPLASGLHFEVEWQVRDERRLALTGSVTTAASRQVGSLDYVIALPREWFVGGSIAPGGTAFPAIKPDDPTFLRTNARELTFQGPAAGKPQVRLSFNDARDVRVVDTWTTAGRWYLVRIPVRQGAWSGGDRQSLALELEFTAEPATTDLQVTIDPNSVRQDFLGFGANYCWVNTSPVIDYTMEHLKSTWYRFELKFGPWVAERDNPGELLRRDFELMRRVQEAGHPWIVSLWRIPEEFYVPRGAGASAMGHGRRIAPERWNEFLRHLGEYLLYVKQHYGAEPDLFSFNEPDLGVDIIFSPEEHRDAIKQIGAHLESLGLKTKQLLGDTANPRDRHLYVLPTAADPEAMRHVGAVSFHSWGGATPEQYAAWGDVAEWIQRPLMVGEAGMDPGAYRNRTYDSYTYGLREMKDHFDFVRHARAQISLYWQFTNDYSLVRVLPDGQVQPTGRFHLLQHLNNLTPAPSRVIDARADSSDVQVLAFQAESGWVVHLLNPGPARRATLSGLPAGSWQTKTTTEAAPLAEGTWTGGAAVLDVPARSMVTLISAAQ